MAFVVPIIANRRRNGRSNTGAVIAGLLIFLIFGVMFFLFFNRSMVIEFQSNIIFMIGGFSVFFMIIIVVCFAAATSKTFSPPKNGISNEYNRISQKQAKILNPYKVSRSTEGQIEELIEERSKRDIPVVEEINYCRYCGAKRDIDAVFCHMCGTKL
jgi:hypothetical protein